MINLKNGLMRIFGASPQPIKYSSAPTRYSSLHGFMQGAEIQEVNVAPSRPVYETDNNYWNMNIRSGVNQSDCPSKFGLIRRGDDKIGPMTFPQGNMSNGWIRNKGEPV